jgi:hypothetical protein
VAREQVEHVVEKAYAGCNRSTTDSIEINFDLDLSLFGLALNDTLAHAKILCSRAFYQGFAGFATALRPVCKYGSS